MFTIPRCSLVLLWLPCREMSFLSRIVEALGLCGVKSHGVALTSVTMGVHDVLHVADV